ncbi:MULTISPECIES: hypothetical protein [Bradyrhizobium]|uniref:hypothetical protein n=1 Tax=Bradyrhizobium TaxID=374 RepID=UPI00140AAE54|nr:MULTISPECIES: hypothetical protein [Bradyrhizobium]MCK7670209.1 hypothetical protein [Bradyrhizobium sp. 2S1]UGY23688.1 hypothetical protein HU675_0038025 [Bradyrhizobium septentrionale]
MKYAVLTAALVSALIATPARASADTEFAAKLAGAMVIKTQCDGYEMSRGSGSDRQDVVNAVFAAIQDLAGASYRAGDMIPEITKATRAATMVTIALLSQNKAGTCKDLGASMVRAGLLERK